MRIFVPLIKKTKRSMKRLLLEQKLRSLGCGFHRKGGNHDIWCYENGRRFPFARHADIEERLAKSMINKARQNRG
jgi:hypothetical protein